MECTKGKWYAESDILDDGLFTCQVLSHVEEGDDCPTVIANLDGYIGNGDGTEAEANAERIVKAVNCHDDLVEAGKKLVKWLHVLADDAEKTAKTTRFITMREAWEADTKNYRATAKDMEAALAKAE